MDTIKNELLLIKSALKELEDSITDSHFEPKSISLLFIDLGIEYECIWKLLSEFTEVLNSNTSFESVSNLEVINIFREKIAIHVKGAEKFSDMIVYKIIRAIASNYMPSLLEISEDLKNSAEIKF